MANGRITSWRADRGFGFIRPDEGGDDIFFHISDLQGLSADLITPGINVTYQEEEGARGLRARRVRPVATPRGSSQTAGSYRFFNPYNFVRFLAPPATPAIDEPLTGIGAAFRDAGLTPTVSQVPSTEAWQLLGRYPPPPHDRYLGLTGSIDCTLTAVTPIFVSDSHAVKLGQDKHRTYRFLQVGENQPVIPGSSLRGVFRSIFEAVTNSCLSIFQEDAQPLEYREARAPEMVPARVLEVNQNTGTSLELLDCTRQAPVNVSGRPATTRAGAVVRAYPPVVKDTRSKTIYFRWEDSNLRDCVPDLAQFYQDLHGGRPGEEKVDTGMRVAALVRRRLTTHRSGRYRFFQVERVVPRQQHQSLRENDQLKKVFGWLHLTGPNIENKHDERLFFRWDDTQPDPPERENVPPDCLARCDSVVVEEYNHHLAGYWERNRRYIERNKDKDWRPDGDTLPYPSTFVQEGRRLQRGDLVYAQFNTKGEVSTLRPVSMPRLRYLHRRQYLLPGHLTRCQEYDELCSACRVFGWVYQRKIAEWVDPNKRVAYAGRVRFSHAQPESFQFDTTPRTLAILSTPKPTTTAFYLTRAGGVPGEVDYNVPDARLRGRKFYRHQGRVFTWNEAAPPPQEGDGGNNQSDQNRTLNNPVQSGARFTFQVDFENLASVELGALLWSLELEEGMYHRLGFAKPLGLGSVKVTINSLRLLDRRARYDSLEEGWREGQDAGTQWIQDFKEAMGEIYGRPFEELPNVRDLKALLSEPALPHVHYPRSERTPGENGENFRWFVGNKRRRPDQGGPLYLPLAEDDTIGLPLLNERGHETN